MTEYYRKRVKGLDADIEHIDTKIKRSLHDPEVQALEEVKRKLEIERKNYLGAIEKKPQ